MEPRVHIRRIFVPIIMIFSGLCAVACGSSSSPNGDLVREAGLWKGEVRIQNLYHKGENAQVQRLMEESAATSCQPAHPVTQVGANDDSATIRRVINIPESGMTIIVEVPRHGGAVDGPVSLMVRRKLSSTTMTEDVLRAQPSPLRPGAGVDVSVGTWKFTRLGDCPPGMRPFEKLPKSR